MKLKIVLPLLIALAFVGCGPSYTPGGEVDMYAGNEHYTYTSSTAELTNRLGSYQVTIGRVELEWDSLSPGLYGEMDSKVEYTDASGRTYRPFFCGEQNHMVEIIEERYGMVTGAFGGTLCAVGGHSITVVGVFTVLR